MESLPSVEDLAAHCGVHDRRVRLRTAAGMDLVAFAKSPSEKIFVVLGALLLPSEIIDGREARLFAVTSAGGSRFMTAETFETALGDDGAGERIRVGSFPVYEARRRDGTGGPHRHMSRN